MLGPRQAGLCSRRIWRLARDRSQALAMVSSRPDFLPPPAVLEIPCDGPSQAAVEGFAGCPTQLVPDLCGVHGVPPVMPRPVCDKGDQLLMRPMSRAREHFVEQSADRRNDVQIGPLGIPTDIVALAHVALAQDREQGASVVLHV